MIIVPSVNTDEMVKMEQGRNKKARQKDVVRMTMGSKHVIVTREELEQGLATLAQGDEVIKYQAPSRR